MKRIVMPVCCFDGLKAFDPLVPRIETEDKLRLLEFDPPKAIEAASSLGRGLLVWLGQSGVGAFFEGVRGVSERAVGRTDRADGVQRGCNPVRVGWWCGGPRVGLRAEGQPWAEGRNPVGIGEDVPICLVGLHVETLALGVTGRMPVP